MNVVIDWLLCVEKTGGMCVNKRCKENREQEEYMYRVVSLFLFIYIV